MEKVCGQAITCGNSQRFPRDFLGTYHSCLMEWLPPHPHATHVEINCRHVGPVCGHLQLSLRQYQFKVPSLYVEELQQFGIRGRFPGDIAVLHPFQPRYLVHF